MTGWFDCLCTVRWRPFGSPCSKPVARRVPWNQTPPLSCAPLSPFLVPRLTLAMSATADLHGRIRGSPRKGPKLDGVLTSPGPKAFLKAGGCLSFKDPTTYGNLHRLHTNTCTLRACVHVCLHAHSLSPTALSLSLPSRRLCRFLSISPFLHPSLPSLPPSTKMQKSDVLQIQIHLNHRCTVIALAITSERVY